jgi:hypothetical protein
MEEKKILEILNKYCVIKENRKYLTCAKVFEIAKELNVKVSVIGKICNQEKIKLNDCQIGCF